MDILKRYPNPLTIFMDVILTRSLLASSQVDWIAPQVSEAPSDFLQQNNMGKIITFLKKKFQWNLQVLIIGAMPDNVFVWRKCASHLTDSFINSITDKHGKLCVSKQFGSIKKKTKKKTCITTALRTIQHSHQNHKDKDRSLPLDPVIPIGYNARAVT